MTTAPHASRTPLQPSSRLQYVPGVGPARSAVLERLGLVTVEDLLRHYPRAYLDARRFVRIADLVPGELLTVTGEIKSAAAVRTRVGRTDFMVSVSDGSGTLGCYFFGQPFLARVLARGARVVVSGELHPLERRMLNPMFEVVEGDTERLLNAGRLIPVHALTKGLTARVLRRVLRTALDDAAQRLDDPLPASLREELDLESLATAIAQIHFPEDDARLERARRRLAFEELFLLQMVMELRRRVLAESARGLVSAGPGRLAERLRESLPFALTADQDQAVADIVVDLRRTTPMHRLLLGDVGSGKTVVALLAAAHVIEARHQVAFMAPTEILARQHAATCARLADPIGLAVGCLTASTPADERRRLVERLGGGEPMLVVGTQALLEEDLKLPALALAIVDEQHRFGVRQRAVLAQKSVMPDVLVLTATPIPRTLTLAYYGDLDVSRITTRPAERGRLVTRVAEEPKLDLVVGFMAKELAAGRQAFVVVPAIDEAPTGGRTAQAEHRRLARHPQLASYRVGLLHGRMKGADKRTVMEEFARGELQVIVATTVVEVGIDVPNATLMVVLGADDFGLTQLHQLRGRVGRGRERSVCVLVPSPGASALALERLATLVATQDGFAIAEADLAMRGPGELWGLRQSGLPRLRVADLARDAALLVAARAAAKVRVASDAQLLQAEHAPLRATLLANYREPLELSLAG